MSLCLDGLTKIRTCSYFLGLFLGIRMVDWDKVFLTAGWSVILRFGVAALGLGSGYVVVHIFITNLIFSLESRS